MSELKRTDKYNSLQDKLTKIQQYVNSIKTVQAEASPPPFTGQGNTNYCYHYSPSRQVIPATYRRPKYMGSATGIPAKIGTKLTQASDVTKMYTAIKKTRDIVNTIDYKVKRRRGIETVKTRKYWTRKWGNTTQKYYKIQDMPEWRNEWQWYGHWGANDARQLQWLESNYVSRYYNAHTEQYKEYKVVDVWEKENVCPGALPIDGKTVTSKDLVKLSHYNSMLQATNAILDSMKRYNGNYDSSDRCSTSCQVYCQQACQASCQNVNWCHDQKCGTF